MPTTFRITGLRRGWIPGELWIGVRFQLLKEVNVSESNDFFKRMHVLTCWYKLWLFSNESSEYGIGHSTFLDEINCISRRTFSGYWLIWHRRVMSEIFHQHLGRADIPPVNRVLYPKRTKEEAPGFLYLGKRLHCKVGCWKKHVSWEQITCQY